jgi:4-hydroxybenzoate polyprenyltransferase
MRAKAWLHSLRIPNLVLVSFVFLLPAFKSGVSSLPQMWLPALICSFWGTLFAYLINDLYDVHADEVNRPGTNVFAKKSSKAAALYLMLASALISMISLFLLPMPYDWISLLILTGAWLYAAFWQKVPWVGILWVSISVAYLVALAMISSGESSIHNIAFFSFLAGSANFLREWAKDLNDLEGDKIHKKGKPLTTISEKKAVVGFRVLITVFLVIWISICPSSPSEYPWIKPAICSFLAIISLCSAIMIKRKPGQSALCLKTGFFLGILAMVLF